MQGDFRRPSIGKGHLGIQLSNCSNLIFVINLTCSVREGKEADGPTGIFWSVLNTENGLGLGLNLNTKDKRGIFYYINDLNIF